MLRISIVILHAFSVLSQPLEYFDGDEAEVETVFRKAKIGDPKQIGVPVPYLYMAKYPNRPAGKQCITCLYDLYHEEGGKMDACKCLPCWVQASKDETAQKFVIGLFENRNCGEVKERKGTKPRKEVQHQGTDYSGRKRLKMETKTNVKNVKYVEDYLQDPDKSEKSSQTVKPKVSRGMKSSLPLNEMIKASEDESHEIVKERVRKMFSSFMNKMARMNKANEELEEVDKSENTSLIKRWTKNNRPEDRARWQMRKRFQNEYQRPTYRVAYLPARTNSKDEGSRKKVDVPSEEEETDSEVKLRVANGEVVTESNIPKFSTSRKGKKAGKKEVSEGIPDDISVGSLTFEDPNPVPDDAVNRDDQIQDDGFTSAKGLTKVTEISDKDYTIQYDDDETEARYRKHKRKNPKRGERKSPRIYHETRNTPSDINESRGKSTEMPENRMNRSEMDETTTPCGSQNLKAEPRASKLNISTEEEPTSELSYNDEDNASNQTSTGSESDEDEGKNEEESESEEENEENEENEEGETEEEENEERENKEMQHKERKNEGEIDKENRGSEIVEEQMEESTVETTGTTERSSAWEAETDSDVSSGKTSPMSEESTETPSSGALVLKFTDESRGLGRTTTTEEPYTEATTASQNSNAATSSYDNSSEPVTLTSKSPTDKVRDSSETSEKILKFVRKVTRSTKPTGGIYASGRRSNTGEKITEVTESTRSDRYLRQTDCSDLKPEESTTTTTAGSVESMKRSSIYRNDTEQKNSRYIIELEEDQEKPDKVWSPEDPILKVKVNIYSNFKQGNVYNFLSRLIPKNSENSEDHEETKKGLQIETNFSNNQSNSLSIRNMERSRRRGMTTN